MVVAIDLDDTLIDLFGVVPKVYSAITGENITKEDFVFEHWDHSLVVKKPTVLKSLFRGFIYDYCQPLPKARDGVWRIHTLGHEVVYVTAADIDDRKTEWLTEWGFAPFPLIVTPDKGYVRCDWLIDDGMHNLKKAQGIGIAYPQPWNAAWPGMRMDWDAIIKYFEYFGEDK